MIWKDDQINSKILKMINEKRSDEKVAFLDKTGLQHLWAQIVSKLGSKVDKVDGKGLSTNDYTTEEKSKLSNIEDGANKTVVDSSLSDTSTNPVQNKIVYEAIQGILSGESSIVIDDGSID